MSPKSDLAHCVTYCSAMVSITRRQPSSEIAATNFASGENTKSEDYLLVHVIDIYV